MKEVTITIKCKVENKFIEDENSQIMQLKNQILSGELQRQMKSPKDGVMKVKATFEIN